MWSPGWRRVGRADHTSFCKMGAALPLPGWPQVCSITEAASSVGSACTLHTDPPALALTNSRGLLTHRAPGYLLQPEEDAKRVKTLLSHPCLQLHLWQEQRHISHLPFPKHFPQRARALCRALGWEGCIGTQESRGRERLQAQSCNLQDVNGLMEGLVNTFQEVRASGSHYKAWRKEFSNNKLRLTFSSRSYVNI